MDSLPVDLHRRMAKYKRGQSALVREAETRMDKIEKRLKAMGKTIPEIRKESSDGDEG